MENNVNTLPLLINYEKRKRQSGVICNNVENNKSIYDLYCEIINFSYCVNCYTIDIDIEWKYEYDSSSIWKHIYNASLLQFNFQDI